MMTYDVAIVGGGIAGFSATLTAKNLKLNYLWLGEKNFGKKTAKAEYVRNYAAFSGSGEEFVRALGAQKERENVVLTQKRVDAVYKNKEGFLLSAGEESFFARAVILATGVNLAADFAGEEFLGRGLSYCAVCDGALYKNKRIAAVAYAEEANAEAEYLAKFAAEVLYFSGSPARFSLPNIRVIGESPKRLEGGLRLEKIVTDKGEYPVDGVFLLGKTAPPSRLLGGLKTEGGHVLVGRDLSTNLKGVFAAGDVTGKPYQFIKAAGEGCTAAYSVKAYLKTAEK